MQVEDLEEFIKIIENNVYSKEKIRDLLDRNGIEYVEMPDGISFSSEEIKKQIINFLKQNRDYIKTMDKKTLIRLILNLPDIVDKQYLKNIVENSTKYDLKPYEIEKLVRSINDSSYTKKVIERREEYGIGGYFLVNLIASVGEISYTKYIIENWEQYGLNNDDIIYLVLQINDLNYVTEIIINRKKYGLIDYRILDLLAEIDDPDYIQEIIENNEKYRLKSEVVAELIASQSEEEIIELLEEVDKEIVKAYRQEYADPQFIREYLEDFIEFEKSNVDIGLLVEMFKKNEDILKSDFSILDDRYINILGKDIINQISSYKEVVDRILKLNDNQLWFVRGAINAYLEQTNGEEWTSLLSRLLENIDEYKELLNNLDKNIDINRLIAILIHKNEFRITTIEDVENFHEIKRKKSEELIRKNTVREKQRGVLLKIFGQSIDETERMVEKYGEDIDEIRDDDVKAYIKSLQEILMTTDFEKLEEIFYKVEELEMVNPLLMERLLKTEYWKLYNDGLFKIKDGKKLQENIYSARTDFNMIITSIAAYFTKYIENYKDDWNRPSMGSQYFCTSYIRNDMLGHPPIPHVCYGFERMEEDSLILSGPEDIVSTGIDFEAKSIREKYLAPNNQIKNTQEHNEMDFRRIQNGQRKQPDYIVVFRKNGEIRNIKQAKKASKDFGSLPIVIIDEDECLISERKKAEKLYERYEATGDLHIRDELVEKLRNNRITNKNFCTNTKMNEVVEALTVQKNPKDSAKQDDLEMFLDQIDDATNMQTEKVKLKMIFGQIRELKGESDEER